MFGSICLLLGLSLISAQFTAEQVKHQQESLTAHNTLRARHCAAPLVLDNQLNQIAQSFAEKLISTNSFSHSSNGYGENLYMQSSSMAFTYVNGSRSTQSWYDEVALYNYNSPGFSMNTGHFTQVVWKGSQRLGVGLAFSSDRKKAVIVANYSPPGNYLNQFSTQVVRASC